MPHAPVPIAGDGEADGIGGAILRETVAASAGVAAIAQIALGGFRRLENGSAG